MDDRSSATLMLVEDERLIRLSLTHYLRQRGYRVLTAGGPTEALELCAQHDGDIDVLVTDMVMPEMTGREVSERIGALKPGIRTIYMSAFSSEMLVEQGRLEPGVGVLVKPFEEEELVELVEAAMATRG